MASDLVIEFGDVLETPTLAPEQEGQVQVVVTNQGDQAVTEPFDISLYASTDIKLDNEPLNNEPLNNNPLNVVEPGTIQRLDGTDERLGTQTINDDFNPGQSRAFTIDFASNEFTNPTVVSPGAYFLIAEADSGETKTIAESNEGNNIAEANNSQFISTDGADVVLDWNSTLLNAIQAVAERPITSPPFAARNAAIVHTAIYEAFLEASETAASPEAAVVGAAYQTLMDLYESEADAFEAQRLRSLAEIPDGAAEDAGFQLGVNVANEILAERENDGAEEADNVPYTAPPTPGIWRPTPTRNETVPSEAPALLPGWENVTPFAITSVDDAISGLPDILERRVREGPPDLEMEPIQYALQVGAVRFLGNRDRYENPDLTNLGKNQAEIAQFWSYDRPDTFGPPGQWQEIAQEIALQQNNTLADNARLFAQLTTALADAGIATWDLKYNLGSDDSLGFNQWRPITAIQEAENDGNRRTNGDPNWEPLLDSPPFPDYVSGHAVFGAAAGNVLIDFFGNNISFDIPSQELPSEDRVRSYNTIREAVRENALSRVYGGVHIAQASVDGVLTGIAVGEAVSDSVLTNFEATIV